MRKLRSKRARNLLYVCQGGQCSICGMELPEGYHADHIKPWVEKQETSLESMQLTCPGCNLRKRTMSLRKHQIQMEQIVRGIYSRMIRTPEFIFAHVCPGGGKSMLPAIAAHYLISQAHIAEKLCWVVPNTNLKSQAAKAMLASGFAAKYFGFGDTLQLMEAANESNPTKGRVGYITTYQALMADTSGVHVQEFNRHKYLLVLDEFHHCAMQSPMHTAVAPLVERSALTIGMTGNLDRADNNPIYPMPYTAATRRVDTDPTDEHQWVQYSIKQATEERAIIRCHFLHVDGESTWFDTDGNEADGKVSENDDALFVALSTSYACDLLDRATTDWVAYRKKHPRSKMLVVCKDIAQARQMLKRIRSRVEESEIATSAEQESDDMIRRFRENENPKILVTVGKAYEGMDVPAITHIACLTHIRSRQWIGQMIARGWRYDHDAGPWGEQWCFCYVPADAKMKQIKADIEAEQEEPVSNAETLRDGPLRPASPDGSYGADSGVPASVIPIASKATDESSSILGGITLTPEETEFWRAVIEDTGAHITPAEAKVLLMRSEQLRRSWAPADKSAELDPTPKERLRALRDTLTQTVNTAAGGNGDRCTEINGRLKQAFGQREQLGEKQLIDAVRWVRNQYPNNFRV